MKNMIFESKNYINRLVDRCVLQIQEEEYNGKKHTQKLRVNKRFTHDVEQFLENLEVNRIGKMDIELSDKKELDFENDIIQYNKVFSDNKYIKNTNNDLNKLFQVGILERSEVEDEPLGISKQFLDDLANLVHFAVYVKLHNSNEDVEEITQEDIDAVIGTACILSVLYFLNNNQKFSFDLKLLERLSAITLYYLNVDYDKEDIESYMKDAIEHYSEGDEDNDE